MKNIAYKVAKNDPNLPDGFIVEHFETDQKYIEGYFIVPLDIFNVLFQNNVNLVRKVEATKNVLTQSTYETSPGMILPQLTNVAEPLPSDFVPPSNSSQPPNNQSELFNQFLAWLASQQNPNNS